MASLCWSISFLPLNFPDLGATFSLSVMTTPGIRSTAPFSLSLFYTWPTGNAQPASHPSIPASLHSISLCVCCLWTSVCFISPSSQLYWSVHAYTNSDPFSDCVSNQTLILVWSMLVLLCTLDCRKFEYVYVCFSCKWSIVIRPMWNLCPQNRIWMETTANRNMFLWLSLYGQKQFKSILILCSQKRYEGE